MTDVPQVRETEVGSLASTFGDDVVLSDADELLDLVTRARAEVASADGACARSLRLVTTSMVERVRSQALRARAAGERQRLVASRGAEGGRVFTVRGLVEGRTVAAYWVTGLGLLCPMALRQRAQVVVALGDTFETTESPPVRAAVAGDPLAVALTLVRSLDRILSVDLDTGARVDTP